GPALEGVYSISLYAPDSDNPSLKAWTTQYGKMFKNEPAFIGTLGGQAVELLAAAVEKAGDPRAYDKIAAALKGQTWPTLLGIVSSEAAAKPQRNSSLVKSKKEKTVGVKPGSYPKPPLIPAKAGTQSLAKERGPRFPPSLKASAD